MTLQLEAPLPRLSLDINDLLCTWEESGTGSIFSGDLADGRSDGEHRFQWDDSASAGRLLDLSDIHASLTAPQAVQVPDMDLTAFRVQQLVQPLGAPGGNCYLGSSNPGALPPFLDSYGMLKPPHLDWAASLPPLKAQPSVFGGGANNTFLDGTWSSKSSAELCSIATPDSGNHCSTAFPSPAAAAAMMLADDGRLTNKHSCESWCTTAYEMPQLVPTFPLIPPPHHLLLQQQAATMDQLVQLHQLQQHQRRISMLQLQQQFYPLEVVDTSGCCYNPAATHNNNNNASSNDGSRHCVQLPCVADCTLQVLNGLNGEPPASLRTLPARRRHHKHAEQSCSSSTSAEQLGQLVPSRVGSPALHHLDLSRPDATTGVNSPAAQQQQQQQYLAAKTSNSGAAPAAPATPAGQQPKRLEASPRVPASQVAIKVEPSPCNSVGMVPMAINYLNNQGGCQEETYTNNTKKGVSMLSRAAGHHAVVATPAAEEFIRTRAEAVERYRQKRARRAYTKKIRYQLRKINADRRPRIKGRFVKKEEMHLYAHLFPGYDSGAGAGVDGADATTNNNPNDFLMSGDLDLDIDGLEMDMDGEEWAHM